MDRVVRLDSFALALLRRPNAGIHAVASAVEHTDLTGRERRRQKNERRLELAASRKLPKPEEEEKKKMDQRRKKKSDPSLANLAKMGMQWYTLRVFTNNEAESMEALRSTLEAEFPDAKFEGVVNGFLLPRCKVWSPIIPTESVVRGKSRFAMKAMLRGHIFLRCVLEAPVYRHVMNERSVFCFVGAFPYKMKAGYDTKMMKGGYPDAHIPAPVPSYQIEALREEAATREREFKLEQQKKKASEDQVLLEVKEVDDLEQRQGHLRVGDMVAVISGAYQNFQGTILEFLPAGKVKIVLPVFGTDTEIEVDMDALMFMVMKLEQTFLMKKLSPYK
ncbi:hypothetical protein SELMODRAFT_418636 [Selaginella moellendorffii]|uniref:KOW domain-containing protein n=1 Tax=Selaginella moellendorffii TaxID=88036 RepID=D8S6N5_SELML|nr:hypothetical protein SELMODRAFT_418636 [Selaginella moellendorffii]